MTAEIVIMNKNAIALAADSAVTVQRGEGQKIFTSVNKLFTLSKFYPVGIMIYGRANFMEVPWETIVKIYRSKLGKKKFNKLKEYANNFIEFLNNDNPLFPEKQQKKILYSSTISYFRDIMEEIDNKVKDVIKSKRKITMNEIKQITSDVIEKHFYEWEEAEILPSIPANHINEILKKYGNIINKAKVIVFEKLPISSDLEEKLRSIGASLFSKDEFPANISGVIIAGFGEEEAFPSLKSFKIHGIVNNKLKYKEGLSREINYKTDSSIIPFAQKEMVYTFMEGIDPNLKDYMEYYLSRIFDKYPDNIVKNIKKLNNKEKKKILKKLKDVSSNIFEDYLNKTRKFRKKNYADPIVKVVSMLPKKELALMAESLVSLTSFKRKVTLESETVAGPIDVAIISKGDGFIWIKRKHYFKPELNPQFFDNYYRGNKK